jgi:cytochrome P450
MTAGYAATTPELSYLEAEELLKLAAATVAGTHPGRAEFVPGAMSLLDGPEHQQRRRMLSRLLGEQAMDRLGRQVLEPSVDGILRRLAPVGGGPVRTDLMVLLEGVFWPLAATMIGIDGIESDQATLALRETIRRVKQGFSADDLVGDAQHWLRAATQARTEFFERYLDPSIERRRLRAAEVQAGSGEAGELADDLITTWLGAGYPAAIIRSDATAFLVGATDNNANAVARCLIELEIWFKRHPEDRDRAGDEVFLQAAVAETIRLHGSTKLRVRRLKDDGELASSGRGFRAGDEMLVDLDRANQDPAIFGADAEDFDPHRAERLDGVTKPYGIAFGAGRHTCPGRALSLGGGRLGRPGILMPVVRALYQAGITFDPVTDPQFSSADPKRVASCPVELRGRDR